MAFESSKMSKYFLKRALDRSLLQQPKIYLYNLNPKYSFISNINLPISIMFIMPVEMRAPFQDSVSSKVVCFLSYDARPSSRLNALCFTHFPKVKIWTSFEEESSFI